MSQSDRIRSFNLNIDFTIDRSTDSHPVTAMSWKSKSVVLADDGTHYGFVLSGKTVLSYGGEHYPLVAGQYFMVPGAAELSADGLGVLVSHHTHEGLFTLGGPIEERGRLRYIDGCADTVLISPTVCGDPCLNLLVIPPGIDQTQHTHPTVRIGVVVDGGGECRTPHGVVPLISGHVFVLPPDAEHSFHTSDQGLRIVVFHPDTDTGPSHDDHPMLNRTIVEGVKAGEIPEIRTR